MNWKLTAGLILLVTGVVVAGALLFKARRQPAGVTVALRVSVTPADQTEFVAAQAKSARFKYLIGKQAGVKPTLAQKLAVRSVPSSATVEAQLDVSSQEEARRYAEGFIESLQLVCGNRAHVALAEQQIR